MKTLARDQRSRSDFATAAAVKHAVRGLDSDREVMAQLTV